MVLYTVHSHVKKSMCVHAHAHTELQMLQPIYYSEITNKRGESWHGTLFPPKEKCHSTGYLLQSLKVSISNDFKHKHKHTHTCMHTHPCTRTCTQTQTQTQSQTQTQTQTQAQTQTLTNIHTNTPSFLPSVLLPLYGHTTPQRGGAKFNRAFVDWICSVTKSYHMSLKGC